MSLLTVDSDELGRLGSKENPNLSLINRTVSTSYFEYIGYQGKKLPNGHWKKKENHKEYMEWLGRKLGYTVMEDWYKISGCCFHGCGGGILNYYKGSPVKLVTSIYPNHNWLIWKFKVIPTGTWNNKKIQKEYMEWLGKELGYTTMEHWYKINQKDIYENYGWGCVSSRYKSSPVKLVTSIYPNHNWLIWKFKGVPKGTWNNKEFQKEYMEWLGKELGYTTMDHWYKINCEDLFKHYGSTLLSNYYKNSPVKLVTSIYPNYNWLIWKFEVVPIGTWKKKKFQKEYMEWLGKELGYTTMEHWYKITTNDIKQNYGSSLFHDYTIIKLVTSIYPNHNWLIWKFKVVPNWKKKKFQKEYMEWLGKELGYTTMEHWYKITINDINQNYGSGLLSNYYNTSPIKLVTSIYPNHYWLVWKFQKVGNNVWKNKKIQKEYMEWLGKELGYTTMVDWYKINQKDIYKNYGAGLLTKHYNGSPIKLVTSIYPNYEWEISKFNYNKTERIIFDFLLNNKSNIEIKKIKLQYKPDWSKNPDTGRHLPYDFYIELSNGKKIIIECDGIQHYEENSHFHRNGWTLEKQQDRDIFKMNKANENDVSIIRVYQPDVWYDRINWEKEITDAINEIKNEDEASVKVIGCLKKDTDKLCWEFD